MRSLGEIIHHHSLGGIGGKHGDRRPESPTGDAGLDTLITDQEVVHIMGFKGGIHH